MGDEYSEGTGSHKLGLGRDIEKRETEKMLLNLVELTPKPSKNIFNIGEGWQAKVLKHCMVRFMFYITSAHQRGVSRVSLIHVKGTNSHTQEGEENASQGILHLSIGFYSFPRYAGLSSRLTAENFFHLLYQARPPPP